MSEHWAADTASAGQQQVRRIRTWLYDNTLPFTDCEEGTEARQAHRSRVRVPEVLAKLAELKGEAFAALDAFMPDYRNIQATIAMIWPRVRICLILTC